MIGPLSYIQIGAGVALGVLLASGPVYLYGKHEGRQEVAIERLQSDIKAERERIDSDAKVQNLSDYDFCVQSLRSRGMRVESCEPLRGIPKSKP
ncbi:hypothetical protein [Phyllobacterium sp. K27]